MLKQSYKFSLKELETIIDKNLTLYKYFQYLFAILKEQTNNDEINSEFEITKTSNILIKSVISNYLHRNDSQNTSSNCEFQEASELFEEQLYQYQRIQQILNSKQFIEKLYPYTNSLLTTTNIGIAKQALRIHMLMESNIDKTKAIHRIKEAVNILTLYQIQKNSTFICANLQQLNQIFCKIGLIISQKQYQFYYNELWDDIQEEQNSTSQFFGFQNQTQQKRKILQISDLLALTVEMQEIQVYKNKLRQWLNSDQYRKFYSKIKANKRKSSSSIANSNNGSEQKTKQVMQQNLNIIKLKIQHMNPNELLLQLKRRDYNVEDHYKKFTDFRKDLLYFHDKEQNKKKFYNNITAKTTQIFNGALNEGAFLGNNRLSNTNMKLNKSNLSSNGSRIKSNCNTGQIRREMQSKLDQKAFNLKIINGVFIRQQILEDINQKRADFLPNGPDEENYELSEISNNESRRSSIVSKTCKYNQAINKQKQNMSIHKQNMQQKKYKSNKRKTKVPTNCVSNKKSQHSQNNQLQNNIKNNQIYNTKIGYFGIRMTNIKAQGFFNLGQKIMKK